MKSGRKVLKRVLLGVVGAFVAVCVVVAVATVAVLEDRRRRQTYEREERERVITLDSTAQKSLDAYRVLLKATLENNQDVLAQYDQRQRDIANDCESVYTGGMPNMHDVTIDVDPHYVQHENGRITLGVTTYTVVKWGSTPKPDSADPGETSWSDDHVLTFVATQGQAKAPYVIHDDETLFWPDMPSYKPLKDLRRWDSR
ncbi:hypothetical protein [Bifidobacterium sp. ESL0790]|uniref:hypothetical protein n=1 Tax=Bifidobacterium sp. ESL0790 TaxID=2983233 RepID=UPI0023F7416C|nr:hypothetical protein [Bifidobacterium sp. ESL0790]WEV71888.1 hypothetical protein OZY47_05370 [Bifidobacterium sp. ESL0790]